MRASMAGPSHRLPLPPTDPAAASRFAQTYAEPTWLDVVEGRRYFFDDPRGPLQFHRRLAGQAEQHLHRAHRGSGCAPSAQLLLVHASEHGLGNDLNHVIKALVVATQQGRQVVLLPPKREGLAELTAHGGASRARVSAASPLHHLAGAGRRRAALPPEVQPRVRRAWTVE